MAQNAAVLATKYFLADLLGGILFFPAWWYTLGLKYVFAWFRKSLKTASQYAGVALWAANLFVPMYGETSIAGRLISFFIRLFMIIFRGIFLAVFALLLFSLVLLYLAILPLSVFGLLFHSAV